MAPGTQRILKRRGRLILVETTNPLMGVGYAVRKGNLGLWNGDSFTQAEREFEKAGALETPGREKADGAAGED